MTSMDDRTGLVTKLIECPELWSETARRLRSFDWDSDDELVGLRPGHLVNVLHGYLSGVLRASDVEGWANAVEGREDIGRASQKISEINEALHWMANPVLESVITPEGAQEWIEKLR